MSRGMNREGSGNLVPGSLVAFGCNDKNSKRAGHPKGATSDAREARGRRVGNGRMPAGEFGGRMYAS